MKSGPSGSCCKEVPVALCSEPPECGCPRARDSARVIAALVEPPPETTPYGVWRAATPAAWPSAAPPTSDRPAPRSRPAPGSSRGSGSVRARRGPGRHPGMRAVEQPDRVLAVLITNPAELVQDQPLPRRGAAPVAGVDRPQLLVSSPAGHLLLPSRREGSQPDDSTMASRVASWLVGARRPVAPCRIASYRVLRRTGVVGFPVPWRDEG